MALITAGAVVSSSPENDNLLSAFLFGVFLGGFCLLAWPLVIGLEVGKRL